MGAQRIFQLLLVLALLLPLAGICRAQDEEEEEYEDELTYVGFGLGFTPTAIFIDLAELNKLGQSFSLPEFKGPLVVQSGNLVLTPSFDLLRNIRIGIYGGVGYKRETIDLRLLDSVYTRTLRFGIRLMMGLQMEYALKVTPRFTILPGAVVGYGSYSLELSQTSAISANFLDPVNPAVFDGDTAATMRQVNRSARMINNHGLVFPFVNFELAIPPLFMVRFGAGYHMGVFDKEWVDEGGSVYTNVPNINANGPVVQLGLFLGLFQQ